MTSPTTDSRTGSAKTRGVACLALALGLMLLLPGCLRLDSFLFEPIKVDGKYFEDADMDSSWHVRWVIPDSLIEPCTLAGLDGNKVYGFFARQPAGNDGTLDDITVIYNHGRGENINRYWGRVELLWEAGCNVFIYDYEGFGKSEGSPSGDACYADARAALSWVRARGVPDSSIVLYAWSLGSFMACHLAADVSDFKPRCLVLENPMASTSALAKEGVVLGIPGSFLADADFDNETRIPLVGCRTLIIYGEKDDTAVPERNALVLLDKADPLATTGYRVENANHSDLPETMGYEEYKRVVWEFIAGGSL
jgi:pimeloyl-ACP methyl ester carboxylesterase